METNQPIVQVETSGCFERQFRALFKRYRKIRSDVQPVIEQLQSGEVLGDRLSGLNIVVFKIRVKNSDIQKGKNAVYRLIYAIVSLNIINFLCHVERICTYRSIEGADSLYFYFGNSTN